MYGHCGLQICGTCGSLPIVLLLGISFFLISFSVFLQSGMLGPVPRLGVLDLA